MNYQCDAIVEICILILNLEWIEQFRHASKFERAEAVGFLIDFRKPNKGKD